MQIYQLKQDSKVKCRFQNYPCVRLKRRLYLQERLILVVNILAPHPYRVICLKQQWASYNTSTGPRSSHVISLFVCKTIPS